MKLPTVVSSQPSFRILFRIAVGISRSMTWMLIMSVR